MLFDAQTELGMTVRPVQRDRGQRLLGDANLFEETRRASYSDYELQTRTGPY